MAAPVLTLANGAEDRQNIPMALQFHVLSDILNEVENLLKRKDWKLIFSRGEVGNILKRSHLQ